MPRICEKCLDELFVPVGGGVGLDRSQFFRLRRQADEVDEESSYEHVLRGCRLRRHARLLLLMSDKHVDWILHPRRALDGGYLRPHPRLKGPVVAGIGLGLFSRRRGAAGLDPVLQHRKLLGGERLALALGGHSRDRIGVAHPLEDQARVGIALRHDAPRLAPLDHQRDRIEPKAGLLLETAMARKAPLGQERPDVF